MMLQREHSKHGKWITLTSVVALLFCALIWVSPQLVSAEESGTEMSKVAPILVNLYRSVTVAENGDDQSDSTVVDPEFYRDFVKFDQRNGEYWLPLQVSVVKDSVQEAQTAVQRYTNSSVHGYGSVLYGEFPITRLPDLNSVSSVLKITGIESGGSLGSSVFLSSEPTDGPPISTDDSDAKKKAR